MAIKRIIKYYKHIVLYAHKFDDPREMNQFFKRHNLPKITHKKIHNLNIFIPIKKLNRKLIAIKNNNQKTPTRHRWIHLRNKLYQFSTIFQKIKQREHSLTHSEANVTEFQNWTDINIYNKKLQF